MRMNSNIILSGQTPDFVDTIRRSDLAAAGTNQINRDNALNSFMQDNGAAVMQGDQNALNGYAAFDPAAALGVQGARQDMQMQRNQDRRADQSLAMDQEKLNLVRQQAAQAAQQEAARMTTAQAAAEAERMNGVIQSLAAAPDEATYNRIAATNDIDPSEYPFEMRDAVLAGVVGAKEAFEVASARDGGDDLPTSFRALQLRAEASGLLPNTPEYQEFMATGGKDDGMSLTTGPDGSISFATGSAVSSGGNGKALTVDEGKNTGFLIRARDAENVLSEYQDEGTSVQGRLLSAAPLGLGNFGQSEGYQLFDQAKRDFVNAILRRESGAVISIQEFDNADKQYFPQPGDGPAVIQQKAENRRNAISGLEVGSGDGINRIQPDAPIETTQPAALPDPTRPAAPLVGVEAISGMTPEQILSLSADQIDGSNLTGLTDAQWDALEALYQ